MSQNQNQKPNPNPNKDLNNPPAGGTHVDPAADVNVSPQQNLADPVPKPAEKDNKIPEGALNKALMRTFRGDVEKNLGASATPEQVDSFVPKKVPTAQSTTMKSTPTPDKVKKKNEAIVHTFKDDVQNLVQNNKMSMARIAAMESDRGARLPKHAKIKTLRKPTIVVMLSIVLLVAAGVMSTGAFYVYKLNTTPNLTPQFDPAILFTEARESIDVTEKNSRGVISLLGNARKNTLFSLGSIVELYLTQLIDTGEGEKTPSHLSSVNFLQIINAKVPETFLQTLGLDYIVGIHVIDESVPFLVLTTQSYGHAFAGMLQWEKNIEEDLTPFFSPNTAFVKPATADGENTFSDTVVENLDVRILRDTNGDIRMLYTFINRTTIVITTNIRTLLELSGRLRVADI